MINFVPAKDSFSGRWLARLGKVLGLRSETVYSRAILLTALAFLVLGGLVVSGVWYAMFSQFDAADVADARQSAAAVREFLGRGEASVPAPSRMSEASGLLGREITFRPVYRAFGKSDSGEIGVKKLPGGQVESSFHFGDGEVVISGSRSFYEAGTSIARLVLVGLAVAGGVALLFILFIVDRTILSRVQLLIDRVEHEKQSERLPVKLDVPGDDEIAQLAGSIEELARLVQIAEREYRNVVEDQTESICRFDAGGKITFSNKAFEALCTAPPTGKRPLLAACLGSGVRTSLEQALGDLRPDKPIAQFTHAGPGDRWYRSILRASFDADGVRTGAQWIASEVTSEVAAQRKLQESRRQLASLSAKLMSLQDEERRRLARELHDSTAQSLAALEINMSALALMDNPVEAKRLAEESGAISRQVCDELRTISYLLHPPLLEEAGLVFALRWLADGFTKRNNLPVSVEVQPDFPRLSPDLETALFRIVQESLSNIYRHAGATKAWIVLGRDEGGGISLEIRDNGEGLPDDFSLARSSGVGLAGMRERMRELGGTLEIESTDYGVAVKCRLRVNTIAKGAGDEEQGDLFSHGPTRTNAN